MASASDVRSRSCSLMARSACSRESWIARKAWPSTPRATCMSPTELRVESFASSRHPRPSSIHWPRSRTRPPSPCAAPRFESHESMVASTAEAVGSRSRVERTAGSLLTIPLTLNAENTIEVFVTAHRGLGLTGAPAEVTVRHDDVPPETTLISGPVSPSDGTTAAFTFTGTDDVTASGRVAVRVAPRRPTFRRALRRAVGHTHGSPGRRPHVRCRGTR